MMLEEKIRALEQRGFLETFHDILAHIMTRHAANDIEGLQLICEALEVSNQIAEKCAESCIEIVRN
jgi:hypothetical protein